MMKRKLIAAIVVGALAAGAGLPEGSIRQLTAMASDEPRKPRFGGSATCTAVCKDGVCRTFSCEVEYAYQTEAEARSALAARLMAEVSREGGRISGSISFSIRASW